MDKIFIQIASYRDSQCGPTVYDLIRKAEHPERISFGICLQWQFEKQEEEATCGPSSLPNWPTIRLCTANANTSRGTCWARSKCQQLWKNEKFTLQIDSHMRAELHWDTQIISCWEKPETRKRSSAATRMHSFLTGHKMRFDTIGPSCQSWQRRSSIPKEY